LRTDGVSVVIPVRNGAGWLPQVLAAIVADCQGRPFEVIVVDDGGDDGSRAIVSEWQSAAVRLVEGPRRGAAAAINAGLRLSRFHHIAQIDQDVVVHPGWVRSLTRALAAPRVAAAQGWYTTDRRAPVLARVMAIDLEQRYERITAGETDHVCTGNVLWRRDAILAVGGLDESLGYGYDNDLSYRLEAAGYQLRICREARSHHHWRDDIRGYLRQQYGFGYGRLDLLARHPRRIGGDRVSSAAMMAHPLLLAVALASMAAAATAAWLGQPATPFLSSAALLASLLVGERAVAGLRAALRFRDPAAVLFPVAHLARDAAWTLAIGVWLARRAAGIATRPAHSMRARGPASAAFPAPADER
jgi:cellulose synthase/poly-beta-1,6-N-acetylglucosamine synthase-like glycosyltransferase